LKISKEQAILTDHAAMFIHLIDIMSKYNTFTKGNFDELPTEAQTVLFSLSYQYGVFSQKYDNIMQKISEKDYHAAAASIQGLDPDGKNYGDRRLKEANLLIQMK
jgi:GH24 family phage-related lysozyme (muramidase)